MGGWWGVVFFPELEGGFWDTFVGDVGEIGEVAERGAIGVRGGDDERAEGGDFGEGEEIEIGVRVWAFEDEGFEGE